MDHSMIQRIGIAVVLQEGNVLVGHRAQNVPLAGMAEFPGGKAVNNEPLWQCAIRECREETGLNVKVTRPLVELEHHYPHGTLLLHFFECELLLTEIEDSLPAPWKWVPLENLDDYRFPPANQAVLSKLRALSHAS